MPIFRHLSPLIPALRLAVPIPTQSLRVAAEAPSLWAHIFGPEDSPIPAVPGMQNEPRLQRPYWSISVATPWRHDKGFVAVSGEVKGNPTESEADVAADRSDEDPLPPEMHHTIRLPAGEAAAKPTDSEERVAADRSMVDPLHLRKWT